MTSRPATPVDAPSMARIYNEGAVEEEGEVTAWASSFAYSVLEVLGFRQVGVHLRHGQVDGTWHDVVVVERLLGPADSRE